MTIKKEQTAQNNTMTQRSFSTAWKASTRPAKQRKYLHCAPTHLRGSLLSCHLSKALRQQYKRRSLPIRTGDKVKILRGSHSGKTGTIERTNLKKIRVYITGIDSIKRDGSKRLIPFHPSNLIIEDLDLKDRRRLPQRPASPQASPPTPSSTPVQVRNK